MKLLVRSLCLLSLLVTSRIVVAADVTRAIIVLDASGSMYGEIGGKTKIDIAKQAITDIVTTLDPSTELGLVVYGHRSKGDCHDIELLIPPSPLNVTNYLDAVRKIQPKGKTPLTAAVLQAAEALKYTEEKADVILITDGLETCGDDPCALAETLAAKGINFRAHVVAFDLSASDSQKIACLSEKTHGQFLNPRDAASLKSALATTLAVAAATPLPTPTATPRPTPKITSGLNLLITLADGKTPRTEGVDYSIYPGSDDSADILHAGYNPESAIDLPPGKYFIKVRFDDFTEDRAFTVTENKREKIVITFAPGKLEATGKLTKDSDPLKEGTGWTILRKPDLEGNQEQVAFSYDADYQKFLQPGRYDLQLEVGNAKVKTSFIIKAGETTRLVVTLEAGILRPTASMKPGSPVITSDLAWTVFGQPNTNGERATVASSYDAQPSFSLPAGAYQVEVTRGQANGKRGFIVASGNVVSGVLVLQAGILKIKTLLADGTPASSDLTYTIFAAKNEEGDRSQLTFTYDAEPKFYLPKGSYVIKTTLQGKDLGEKEITLESGGLVELEFKAKE